MDAVIPEVDLVDVLIAGTAFFPGDEPDDPPMVMRDLPVLVVTLPWEDVQEQMTQWGHADHSLSFTVTAYEALFYYTLYEPYVSFKIRVPLPEYEDALMLAMESGWISIQSDDSLNCVLLNIGG